MNSTHEVKEGISTLVEGLEALPYEQQVIFVSLLAIMSKCFTDPERFSGALLMVGPDTEEGGHTLVTSGINASFKEVRHMIQAAADMMAQKDRNAKAEAQEVRH